MAATTLRSFQSEIEEIQKQGIAKKRVLPASEKENRNPTNDEPTVIIGEKQAFDDELVDESELQVSASPVLMISLDSLYVTGAVAVGWRSRPRTRKGYSVQVANQPQGRIHIEIWTSPSPLCTVLW